MPAKKSPQSTQKRQPSKASQKNSSRAPSGRTVEAKAQKRTRSMAMRVIPYVLCVLSLLLAVCFILVSLDGSAGAIGYAFQAFFCALFGGAAFALPLILGYIGVKWCVFNVKWNNDYLDAGNAEHIDYIKAKRRMVLMAVMTVLTLIMIATFIGVLAEQSDFDIQALWDDGIELEGGGLLGGALACFFIMCFDVIISIVIICILVLLFVILALGLTPDYIITRLRDNHLRNAQLKAQEKEELLVAEAQKPKTAPAPTAQQVKQAKSPVRETSVDELLADNEDISPAPLSKNAQEHIDMQDIPIGPSEEQAKRNATATANAENASTPLDFGGDGFDTSEFGTIDSVIKGLDTPIAPSRPTAEVKADESPVTELNISEMQSDELLEDMAAVTPDDSDDVSPEVVTPYVFPTIDFLTPNKNQDSADHTEELQSNAKVLVETLRSFRVGVKEVTYSRGPTITRYELKPEVGTRVRSIANLVDDIALNLATSGVRIEAPIPGKAAVGIEVPNQTRATVYLRDLIESPKFTDSKSKLTAALGMDVGGNPIHFDIGKMPHLLIAGTTGSGKSICINCIIVSILYKAKPEELKLILIDPKKVEFNMYKNIPHLYCPIVSEPKKAAGALASAVAEMERRFELIEQAGVRDIASYNAAAESDPTMEFMPHMVIIIDELADLMMTARDEVETSICRIAQKARAAGIHMILGTQRPSVDVITGLIKANVPSRIACTVMSQVDSRTIIDVAGAENLIGRGDMLFAPVGASKPMRVQGAFVSENEIEKIVTFIKENNGNAKYNTEFINRIEEEAAKCGNQKKGGSGTDIPEVEGGDSKFNEAVRMAIEEGKISTSLMQRKLGVGYGRAAKMIDTMEELGYVSKPDGNKPRRVLITMEEYSRRLMDGELGGEE